MKILVTGATGNVGQEVLTQLRASGHQAIAGLRDAPSKTVSDAVQVDFAAGIGSDDTFDAIFLMRPPQLADATLFEHFLKRYSRDTRIVFLSVQGADRRSYLPHAKIEKVITQMGFPHVFVRPGYFMENLLTTLWRDLQDDQRIYLPAAQLGFDWVSARDVAAVAVAGLINPDTPQAVTVSSGQLIGFAKVCAIINELTGSQLRYQPASIIGYVRHARRKGHKWSYILVMLMLHALPRLTGQSAGDASVAGRLLGRPPETLRHFVTRNAAVFQGLRGQGGQPPPA
ncbi:NmrA family NAD(P)-binding protein [Yoonia sp. 208BN28-4]|uniref:NmrA family NAD(P)-binding protein n=1 Tax=Yoonia sp. 208BN28-4 TaxID=3126505 RepID=UPI0030B21AEB